MALFELHSACPSSSLIVALDPFCFYGAFYFLPYGPGHHAATHINKSCIDLCEFVPSFNKYTVNYFSRNEWFTQYLEMMCMIVLS